MSVQALAEGGSPGPSWTSTEAATVVPAPMGDPEQAHASWEEVGRQPVVSVDVYRYAFPGWAKVHFWLDQPSRSLSEEWPDITEDDGSELQFASDADAEQTSCGIGDSNGCRIWYLWLRYGQYCVLIHYAAPDYPISDTEMFELSESIVDSVEDQLN